MADKDVELALWLGQAVLAVQGSATQAMVLEDIAERVSNGTDYKDAVSAVTTHDPKAGDFGVEIVGSMVAVAVIDGLKVFWTAYVKELEEKGGKSLADATVDWIKSRFHDDVAGPAKAAIQTQMKTDIQTAATKLQIGPQDLSPTLDAIEPTLAGDRTPTA